MPPEVQSAGATPVVGGATPSQTPPAQPAAGTTPATPPPPATDGTEQLGDAGKQALDRMKADLRAAEKRAKDAEQRAETAENATRSDADKAIADAKKQGAAEVEQRYQARIRAADVRAALTAAGMPDPEPVLGAREFAELKVTDVGTDGLAEAVQAFKAAHPTLFTPTTPQGSADQGARGTGAPADVSPGLGRMRQAYENSGKK